MNYLYTLKNGKHVIEYFLNGWGPYLKKEVGNHVGGQEIVKVQHISQNTRDEIVRTNPNVEVIN